MILIELTAGGEATVLVNPQTITTITTDPMGLSPRALISFTSGTTTRFKETPDEVLTKIEEAEREKALRWP